MESQHDRASTNKYCLKKLKENLKDENPARNICAPHTLINDGKQATVVENYAEDFRKKSHKVIQYPVKVRDIARDIFDETIVDAGGVIFFVKYEQCFQIATHGSKS